MYTGDGGRMDDEGFVYVVDRIKDMIIGGGENVYSAEVENAMAQHTAVATCAVIGIPNVEWGETVHAVVVLKPGKSEGEKELIAHCKSLIASYKCPRSVAFATCCPFQAPVRCRRLYSESLFGRGMRAASHERPNQAPR
jgi:acyl-CoA synthetase (AMP-forming)/AMP-acid ligase II